MNLLFPLAEFALGRPRALAAACVTCAVCAGPRAHAVEPPRWDPGDRTTPRLNGEVRAENRFRGDGVYGRFDGDLSLALGLGVDAGSGTRGAALGRALYFHSLGLFAGYSDAFGGDAALARVAFAGLELRPLFLTRWSLDREFGSALLDLTLDSLAFEFGGFVAEPDGRELGDSAGVQATLGFGVPLFATAQGPWVEARAAYRSGLSEPFAAVVLLSWYGAVLTPIVR